MRATIGAMTMGSRELLERIDLLTRVMSGLGRDHSPHLASALERMTQHRDALVAQYLASTATK